VVSRRLLVSAQPGELRAAWIEEGRLTDLVVQRDDHPSLLGDIYLGRVAAIDRGLAAVFVEIGRARPGLLPLSEAPKGTLNEGAAVTVRVVRDAAPDKGPRLTARLRDPPPDLPSLAAASKPPCRLVRGDDPVSRLLSAEPPPDEILVDEAETCRRLRARLAAVRPGLAEAVRLDPGPEPLFEQPFLEGGGAEEAIEALLSPRVPLPSGGALFIEPTRGMTAIDVDSGAHQGPGGAGAAEALALAVDLEAAGEIPRQLRLRALSGLIVVDFLELRTPERRRRVVEALRAGLAADPEPGQVRPMSPSGLVEMTRRRGRPPLHEVLTEPCGPEGSGRAKTARTLAYEALRAVRRSAAAEPAARLVLRAAPAVVAALEGPAAAARAALEERLGRALALEAVGGDRPRDYDVVLLRPGAGVLE
jgi:Ribonuclease G/E